jgi:hypothetical protein
MFHNTKVFNKSQIKQVARFIIVLKRKLGGSPAQIQELLFKTLDLANSWATRFAPLVLKFNYLDRRCQVHDLASAIKIIEVKEANRVAHELAESSFFLNKSSCIWVDEPSAFLKVYNHKWCNSYLIFSIKSVAKSCYFPEKKKQVARGNSKWRPSYM